MIPTLSVPNIQVAPPVDVSAISGQNSDAALGRLPVVTVPPAISNARVADDNRGGQNPQRNATPTTPASPVASSGASFSLRANGELVFESPYSTTFVAQLFGQFQTADDGLGALAGQSTDVPLGFVDFDRLSQFDITKYMPSFAFRPSAETPAPPTQQEAAPQPSLGIKNAPGINTIPVPDPVADTSPAANSSAEATAGLQDVQPTIPNSPPVPEKQVQPRTTTTAQSNPSLFANAGGVLEAYSSTQSRNTLNLAPDSRGASTEVSLIS